MLQHKQQEIAVAWGSKESTKDIQFLPIFQKSLNTRA